MVATREAARRWKETWEAGWPRGDVAAVAALYAPSAEYRSLAFAGPRVGQEGVTGYLRENFTAESDVECRFGDPLVDGDRAAVEWWASWVEDGAPLTMAGTTVLRFDADGRVVDHRDYWYQQPERAAPYPGWSAG